MNFLYKTVFIPIVSYGFRAWENRIDHTHIAKTLNGIQRQILINKTGAYRTASQLAL